MSRSHCVLWQVQCKYRPKSYFNYEVSKDLNSVHPKIMSPSEEGSYFTSKAIRSPIPSMTNPMC